MNEYEERAVTAAEQKEKIRKRYKGIDADKLDVIPALPRVSLFDDTREKRVAVYARVSTDDPRQTSSYELQKNHYTDFVSRHDGWKLTEIYADEGISGTSLQHRDAFVRMIRDCEEGKIDMIITKSVSRFARNIMDCIGYVRKLNALDPPVGVYFETEGIDTLKSNYEMQLSFISTLAQEESHNKSEIMNSSIEMRFRRGIFLTPPLLGYDQDEEGNLVINPEEAKTVRLIFFMYLYGYSTAQIAATLTDLKRPTKKGNTAWSQGSVLGVLQNERHCGDVLARKTWTPNYLDHKSKKNRQERNQYRQREHHEAIITRSDFIAVQHMIRNAKYGGAACLPQLTVIKEGALKGFVIANTRWQGFSPDDYREASKSAGAALSVSPKPLVAKKGAFDLRGFEIARGQFFSSPDHISVSFFKDKIRFSRQAVSALDCSHIQILIHPDKKVLIVRKSEAADKCACAWRSEKAEGKPPKPLPGTALFPTLFALFDWQRNCRYTVIGSRICQEGASILYFSLSDAEITIPKDSAAALPSVQDAEGDVTAIPLTWTKSFGEGVYPHQKHEQMRGFAEGENWQLAASGDAYSSDPAFCPTHPEHLKESIEQMLATMKKDDNT